jgi:hypothetical protein
MAGGGNDISAMFGGGSAPSVPGLADESNMPDVPVTDGANAGPGAGQEALGLPDSDEKEYLATIMMSLEYMANTGRSDAARNAVRKMKYSI